MKKTFVYIDGFNLYYSLKHAPFKCKWLNLQKLSSSCLRSKEHRILKIKYFTSRVQSTEKDPLKDTRQDIYLRAVKTLQNTDIILGKFRQRELKGFICNSEYRKKLGINTITIKKWEEKQSDVNIATELIADAYQDKYDCAVLISNDTDLVFPLLHIKQKLKKLVIVISPYTEIHTDLKKCSHFYKTIPCEIFKECQFPEVVALSAGRSICKPSEW